MRWSSHKVTTVTTVYALTGSLVAATFAAIGSILPDSLEFKIIPHRTVTHWPYPFVLLALLSWARFNQSPGFIPYIAMYVMMGYLGHLAEDYLSKGGIPFGWTWHTGYKGANWYITKGPREPLTVFTILGAAALLANSKGFLTAEHVTAAIKDMIWFTSHLVT